MNFKLYMKIQYECILTKVLKDASVDIFNCSPSLTYLAQKLNVVTESLEEMTLYMHKPQWPQTANVKVKQEGQTNGLTPWGPGGVLKANILLH